jgi:hypothetical protein
VTPDPAAAEHFRRLLAEGRPETRDTMALTLLELQVSDAAAAHDGGDGPAVGRALAAALAVSAALGRCDLDAAAALGRTVAEIEDDRAH